MCNRGGAKIQAERKNAREVSLKTSMKFLVLSVFLTLLSTSCMKPVKVLPLVEIKPNETCFLIPLEGASKADQAKFMSAEFLNENKIATKRVTIPMVEHSIGRFDSQIEWVPAVKVICVDRTPVTREWTGAEATGTSKSDQAISVESVESINFKVGVTSTGVVTEEDAATFQYWYAGKPLAEVMDENVRGFIVSYLSREFGKISLDDARLKKSEVFTSLSAAAVLEFKPKGITLTNVGSSEGLSYDDVAVQDSINKAWTAQRDRDRSSVERETELINADKDAQAAVIRAKGTADANRVVQESLTGSILTLRKIEKWDGHLPKVTGEGSIPMIDLKD